MILYGYETSRMADTNITAMMNSGAQLDKSVTYTSLVRNGASIVAYPADYVDGVVGTPTSFKITYKLIEKVCDDQCILDYYRNWEEFSNLITASLMVSVSALVFAFSV